MDERSVKRLLDPVMRRIRLLCSRGRVNTVTDEHRAQNLQVSLLSGETVENVERLQNYGFSSVPTGGNDVVVLSVGGKREHLVALAVEDRGTRPQAKSSGDVIVYHAEGHYVRLTADGRAIVTCKNIEFHVDEKTEFNARSFELNAEDVVINAVNTALNTNVTMNGRDGGTGTASMNVDLTNTGHSTLQGGATISGREFMQHKHPETGDGGGTTEGPV
ncbi:TPA: phage baseplate assembly protein V [Klebsiella pneumoniae]|uniref:phage baseplate assembly protein V n=1 Tax=Klebsiella pneumoniae TaxID=573 RepID=UPI001648A08D|nr:phage baseplate assembly protein V [Klebsiella pneumoniae]EKW2891651.1 phage baseplate assembly protein V [Klebsiella pneumoniae]ELA0627910.1 phage baseplate assembly protein V [Klebsiella pneumoniae]MBC4125384.1 phage baseplate assembly protein V [Klebsiella pneumoniae]MCD9656144.1 phage baseplate assembly protein V [Klebsiella pneumoniae]MCD9741391.1 phage baseplate assembly protein V [Klebsiella pneumoniae]